MCFPRRSVVRADSAIPGRDDSADNLITDLIKFTVMKTYKILSIVFIVICVGLMVGLFTCLDFSAGQKIVFGICLCVIVALMVYNLILIKRKEKQE